MNPFEWAPSRAAADWSLLVPILGGLVGLFAMALRAFLRLQRRQEERDDAVAARETKNLQVMEDIARPLRQIPGQLAAHGEALRGLREQQEHSFRALSMEIRDAGQAAREATRELIAEIRAAFRVGGPGNHRA